MEVIGHYHNLLNKCHIRPITSINFLLTSDNFSFILPITSINFLLTSDNFFFLTSSLRTPKIFVKEFSYFLMPCHQHGLGVNLLVQR